MYIPPTSEDYERASKERYDAQKPEPLPKRRIRELSPPPKVYWRPPKRPRRHAAHYREGYPLPQSLQEESLLFQRLPAELRLYIWQLALGGDVIHIRSKKGRLGHVICDRSEACQECQTLHSGHGKFSHDWWSDAMQVRRGERVADEYKPLTAEAQSAQASKLNVLLTCRQVYSEAIDALYSQNTFQFNNLWTPHFFRISILPKRLRHVRSISILNYFPCYLFDDMDECPKLELTPTPEEDWDSACAAISAFSNLQRLHFAAGRYNMGLEYTRPHDKFGFVTLIGVFSKLKGLGVARENFRIEMADYPKSNSQWCSEYIERVLNAKGVRCTVSLDKHKAGELVWGWV